ncbi:hypothetical protein AWENTII_006332 [Aspergillus wentii]
MFSLDYCPFTSASMAESLAGLSCNEPKAPSAVSDLALVIHYCILWSISLISAVQLLWVFPRTQCAWHYYLIYQEY